jgi:hypothetical protein
LDIISLIIAAVLLIAIFLISRTKYFLLAAVVSNFPLLSIFAYSQSSRPKATALYLAVFSFIVSASFVFIYFTGCQNKYANVLIIIAVWIVLSASAFLLLKHFGLR